MQLHRTGTPPLTKAPRAWRRRSQRAAAPALTPLAPAPLPLGELPPAPAPAPAPAPRQTAVAAPPRPERIGGGRLLAADMRVGFMLLNEGRHRVFERVLGLSREQTNIATVIAMLMAAEAAHTQYRRVIAAPKPSLGELAFGTAAVRQVMLGPESTAVADLGVFAALGTFVLAGRVVIPTAVKSVHGLRTAAREFRSLVNRRYLHPATAR